MINKTQGISREMGRLAEDARALIAATVDVAGAKVAEARARLATALDSGKEVYGGAYRQALDVAGATDKAVRDNSYQVIGIGVGLGVLIGYLVGRQCCSRRE